MRASRRVICERRAAWGADALSFVDWRTSSTSTRLMRPTWFLPTERGEVRKRCVKRPPPVHTLLWPRGEVYTHRRAFLRSSEACSSKCWATAKKKKPRARERGGGWWLWRTAVLVGLEASEDHVAKHEPAPVPRAADVLALLAHPAAAHHASRRQTRSQRISTFGPLCLDWRRRGRLERAATADVYVYVSSGSGGAKEAGAVTHHAPVLVSANVFHAVRHTRVNE